MSFRPLAGARVEWAEGTGGPGTSISHHALERARSQWSRRLRLRPSAATRFCHHGLAFPEPDAQSAPDGGERRGHKRNSGHAEPEPGEERIGPGADLVTSAVNKGIDETLRLIFVFPPENGEKHLARRAGDGEISRPPQHLKNRQQSEHRNEAHPKKAERAENGQESESDSDSKPFQQSSGEKELAENRKSVYRQVELGEEGGARSPIMKLMTGDIGLLEVDQRAGDGVEKHESANA